MGIIEFRGKLSALSGDIVMKLIAVIAAVLLGSAANATTLTFDYPNFGGPVVEQGYTYLNNSSYSSGGNLLLHDDILGLQSTTFSRVGGGSFNSTSVKMSGFNRAYVSGTQAERDKITDTRSVEYSNWVTSTQPIFNNFTWNGYQNGSLVASFTGNISSQQFQLFQFGSGFTNLTSLELVYHIPNGVLIGYPYTIPANTVWCHEWCGDIVIDDLSLSEVPLPASLPLLAVGLLGLGWIRWRGRFYES